MKENTKHYVRIDEQKRIVFGFSTAFVKQLETDICINENAGRHFEINGEVNPSLYDENGIPRFKYYYKKVVLRTAEEIQTDLNAIEMPKSQLELLQETVDMLLLESLGGL